MAAFIEVRGATVAYEYADVTIVAVGPYGRRERPVRIPFDAADTPLIRSLLKRMDEAEQKRIAEAGGGMNMGGIG